MIERHTPVLGFVAPSGSGKTTLLRRLVPILRARGLRIGYLKHAHHRFDLDVPGKDSYEIRAAGADQTLIASSERWALQVENAVKGPDPDLQSMLSRFHGEGLDLILIEGFKHATYPKIEVHRAALSQAPLYPSDPDIIAVATDQALVGDHHPKRLPLDDPDAIADFILTRVASLAAASEDPRMELLRYYQWLRRYGLNDSHSGNASVRVGDWFWITPTGAGADTLTADRFIRCPIDGDCPPGASLDCPLHRAVYLAQPQARAILHSHGPHSVALSLTGLDFRPVDFEGQLYFPRVPVLPIEYPRYVADAPAQVARALAESPIAMVLGHGVYAWGETLERAYKWTCSLEASARIQHIARQAQRSDGA